MNQKKKKWISLAGITNRDALRLARELIERVIAPDLSGIPLLNRCRDIISQGCEAYRRAWHSVPLSQAIEVSLRERAARRARTTYEIRNICSRLLQAHPALGDTRLRDITADMCREALEDVFRTELQFTKARAVLHSVFACAVRHGWCSGNPIDSIPRPVLKETEVEPLPWAELCNLLRTAALQEHRCCIPALGMMLWAGIRPAELQRLCWEDIDWQEKVISLRPRHSKTGGARHITLHPALIYWLKKVSKNPSQQSGSICPPNWDRRWKALRRAAGICRWQQDVLRHTFASYHLKRWHDLPRLQEEMGHRSARLLRTRYLSMRGITSQNARLFWTPGKLG